MAANCQKVQLTANYPPIYNKTVKKVNMGE